MSNNKKKIKVAFVLGALNRGGAESLILDVCKNLMHSSFDCLCIYRKEGNMSEDFYKSGVRILHIPKKRSMLAYMWHMRKLLQDEKVDIVHSQTPSNSLILSFILLFFDESKEFISLKSFPLSMCYIKIL